MNDITNNKVNKTEKEKSEEEEDEEEEELYDKTPANPYKPVVPTSTLKELPRFDTAEFFNLPNIGADVKELLSIMNK